MTRRARNASDDLRRDIDELRRQVVETRLAIVAVEAAPATPEEILERLTLLVDGHERQAREAWNPHRLISERPDSNIGAVFAIDPLGAMAILGGRDVVIAALAREAAAVAAGRGQPMSESHKSAEAGRLRADLRRIEMHEETIIRRAEIVGVAIPRRADSDPAILLAPDAALAG